MIMNKKEIKIAFGSMKKTRSTLIVFGLMAMFIAMFMNICRVSSNVKQCFDDFKDKTSASDMSVFVADSKNSSTDSVEKLKKIPKIDEVSEESVLYFQGILLNKDKSKEDDPLFSGSIIVSSEKDRNMNKTIRSKDIDNNVSDADIVYVPYSMSAKGVKVDDEIKLLTDIGFEKKFKVGGFVEVPYNFILMYQSVAFEMNESAYNSLISEYDKFKGEHGQEDYQGYGKLYGVNIHSDADEEQLSNEIKKCFSHQMVSITTFEEERTALETNVNLYSSILSIFSYLLLFVMLIVIAFRIKDVINNDSQKIATLKAIGYKKNEIKLIYMLQFGLPIIAMSAIGIMISYLFRPILEGIVLSLTGIIWNIKFDLISDIITLLIIFVFVVIMLILSTRKLSNISPVSAFQSEVADDSSKSSMFTLLRSKFGPSTTIALRSIFINKGQSIIVVITCVLLTFVTGTISTVTSNLTNNDEFWYRIIGEESCDYLVTFDKEVDYKQIMKEIKEFEGIERVNAETVMGVDVKTDNSHTSKDQKLLVVENYSKMKYLSTYDGRFPENENEIAVSSVLADKLDIGIGDSIDIEYLHSELNKKTYEYNEQIEKKKLEIVGLTKTNSNYSLITTGCYDSINGNEDMMFQIYAKDGHSYDDFLSQFETKYGKASDINENGALSVSNWGKTMAENKDALQTPFNAISVFMMIITLLIVAFVVTVIVKAIIFNKKIQFGVQKAMGYSDKEVRRIVVITIIPCVVLGCLIGCLLSCIFIQPLVNNTMSLIFGLVNAKIALYILPLIIVMILIIAFSYLISYLMSRKIKKITVYTLLSE